MTAAQPETPTPPARGVVPRRTAVVTFAAVAAVGLALDVITKVWAVAALEPATPVPLVGDLLRLYLIRNPGAAFSIGDGYTWVFTLLAAAVLTGLLAYVVPRLRHRGWAVGLGLVGAGIAGNLIDRLTRPPGFAVGHVVDFLQLPHWPIFNVADMCVTGGAVLTMIVWFRSGVGYDGVPDPERKPKATARVTETPEEPGEGRAR
ncbi:signal peptidase II [Mariniluteicoccus flavus]